MLSKNPIRNQNISWRLDEEIEAEVIRALKADRKIDEVKELPAVILVTGNTAYGLNYTAGKIWQLIDGRSSVADIAREMMKVFIVDESVLQLEINQTLDLFQRNNWIE